MARLACGLSSTRIYNLTVLATYGIGRHRPLFVDVFMPPFHVPLNGGNRTRGAGHSLNACWPEAA
jgi:hypothetical protein